MISLVVNVRNPDYDISKFNASRQLRYRK